MTWQEAPAYHLVEDHLTRPEVRALLRDHLAAMHASSPAGSVHALDVAALTAPDVTFWTAWDGTRLAGCAALAELDLGHGELKSFRTHPAYLRRGVASALLDHLVATAHERGYLRLSLETGSGPAFEAAHALYRRHGFEPTGPFAGYSDDPFSRFFTRGLSTGLSTEPPR